MRILLGAKTGRDPVIVVCMPHTASLPKRWRLSDTNMCPHRQCIAQAHSNASKQFLQDKLSVHTRPICVTPAQIPMKLLIIFIQCRSIQPRCLVPCCEICMNAIYSYSFDHGNVDVPHHGTKGAHLCPTLKIKRAQDRQLLCDYFHIRWIHDKQ